MAKISPSKYSCFISEFLSNSRYSSSASEESRILKKLGMRDIAGLGEKLFDFETLDEVHAWIESRVRQKGCAEQEA